MGERYAIWFEAERQASLATQAIAYDTETGRRWTLGDVGSVHSYPAISGDLAVWCSAKAIGRPAIHGVRIGSGGMAGGGPAVRRAGGVRRPRRLGGKLDGALHGQGDRQRHELARGGRTLARQADRARAGRQDPRLGPVVGDGGLRHRGRRGRGRRRDDDARLGPDRPCRTGLRRRDRRVGRERRERQPRDGPPPRRRPTPSSSPRWTAQVIEVAVSGDTVAWIESSAGAADAIVTARLPQ